MHQLLNLCPLLESLLGRALDGSFFFCAFWFVVIVCASEFSLTSSMNALCVLWIYISVEDIKNNFWKRNTVMRKLYLSRAIWKSQLFENHSFHVMSPGELFKKCALRDTRVRKAQKLWFPRHIFSFLSLSLFQSTSPSVSSSVTNSISQIKCAFCALFQSNKRLYPFISNIKDIIYIYL